MEQTGRTHRLPRTSPHYDAQLQSEGRYLSQRIARRLLRAVLGRSFRWIHLGPRTGLVSAALMAQSFHPSAAPTDPRLDVAVGCYISRSGFGLLRRAARGWL